MFNHQLRTAPGNPKLVDKQTPSLLLELSDEGSNMANSSLEEKGKEGQSIPRSKMMRPSQLSSQTTLKEQINESEAEGKMSKDD